MVGLPRLPLDLRQGVILAHFAGISGLEAVRELHSELCARLEIHAWCDLARDLSDSDVDIEFLSLRDGYHS
jgi:hypothetical protein